MKPKLLDFFFPSLFLPEHLGDPEYIIPDTMKPTQRLHRTTVREIARANEVQGKSLLETIYVGVWGNNGIKGLFEGSSY